MKYKETMLLPFCNSIMGFIVCRLYFKLIITLQNWQCYNYH